MRADQTANPVRSPESDLHAARRGISLWSARYHLGPVARDGVPLLASSLARRIPRFCVRGGRAARRPVPGPPAPSDTMTAAAAESCKANAPVAYFKPPFRAKRRSRLFKFNNSRNAARKPAPVICFFFELPTPEPCQRIIFRPPAILGRLPFSR